MICTADCTVFTALEKGFESRYIPECHWVENLSSDVTKTGQRKSDTVTVYIPSEYSALAPKNTDRDMIVKGRCDFVFDNTDDSTVSESMREFRKHHKILTVKEIDCKLYGRNVSHIKVVAK